MDDLFDTAAQELEKSIREDEKTDEKDGLVKAVTQAAADFLAKGKGAQTSDLSADKDKRGELTQSGKDPAESPKKSGQGYSDSSKYEARKGEDADEDDSDDDDMPSFFKKKGKKKPAKKMKKSEEVDEESEESDDEEVFDASEFVEELGGAVDSLGKSVRGLEEGLAIFGEVLVEMADPRRDNMLVNMAKAIAHIADEQKTIKKSLETHNTLMKSIAQMPGVPRVVGLQSVVAEADAATGTDGASASTISKSDRDRLFNLAARRMISAEDMKKAVRTGDVSILKRFDK